MFIFKLKSYLLVFCLTLLTSNQAFSSEKLNLLLQQSIDANCDGRVETPYSATPLLKVTPQQCVSYKISVKNISGETLNDVAISGKIPPDTQLLANSIHFYKNDELYLNSAFKAKYSALINSQRITLSPHKTITLFYSVRVN